MTERRVGYIVTSISDSDSRSHVRTNTIVTTCLNRTRVRKWYTIVCASSNNSGCDSADCDSWAVPCRTCAIRIRIPNAASRKSHTGTGNQAKYLKFSDKHQSTDSIECHPSESADLRIVNRVLSRRMEHDHAGVSDERTGIGRMFICTASLCMWKRLEP
jgi:hypothetical protein